MADTLLRRRDPCLGISYVSVSGFFMEQARPGGRAADRRIASAGAALAGDVGQLGEVDWSSC